MKVRFLVLLFGVGAAAVACADPFKTKATLATIDDTAAVFALTGAPESAPTAINITFPRAVIATPGEHYDVVFDIRNDSAFAYPPHAVGVALTAGLELVGFAAGPLGLQEAGVVGLVPRTPPAQGHSLRARERHQRGDQGPVVGDRAPGRRPRGARGARQIAAGGRGGRPGWRAEDVDQHLEGRPRPGLGGALP